MSDRYTDIDLVKDAIGRCDNFHAGIRATERLKNIIDMACNVVSDDRILDEPLEQLKAVLKTGGFINT